MNSRGPRCVSVHARHTQLCVQLRGDEFVIIWVEVMKPEKLETQLAI